MPYHRPAVPPSDEVLVHEFESAIRSLVMRFRNHPYVFYTETDMHCYLYHRLYGRGTINGLYEMADKHQTILLHKEYPTVARYERQNGMLVESETGRRRGAFDICLWDPKTIKAREHRKQKVLCAAELALNECGRGSLHTLNDVMKLSSALNAVRYPYLLFFVRDNPAYRANQADIDRGLANAVTQNVRSVFCMVEDGRKPKPRFEGDWAFLQQ